MTATRIIATLGGVGFMRPAPGSWGSAAALALGVGLHAVAGFWVFFVATFVAFGVGLWAVQVETRGAEDHDPSEIVVDELVGQWIALWPVSFGAMFADVSIVQLWPGLIAGFVAFRAFDILKPGPVGMADRMETPFGVMLDDVIAGWLATLIVVVLGVFYHLVLI